MLKPYVDTLRSLGYIYTKLENIDLKSLGSRKKLKLFEALTPNKSYVVIFFINTKSRFLQKNVPEVEALVQKLSQIKEHNYFQKIVIIQSPLCSLAKAKLLEAQWKIHDSM
jgi:hypothetical protein